MQENNAGGGVVYGFVTTGELWRMMKYDGKEFCLSRLIQLLFGGMKKSHWLMEI